MNYKKIAFTGVLTALIAVSAFFRIPSPIGIPFTLQMFIVLLIPMIFGIRISFAAVALYIILGLVGFPIFVNGGGIGYVAQPSFGFLVGFLLSTIPNGLLSYGGSAGLARRFVAGLTGFIVIEFVGLIGFWLNLSLYQGKSVSLSAAFAMVILPFVLIDFGKLIVATIIAPAIRRVIRN